MKPTIVVVAILALAPVALAQLSIEEANARLAERQKAHAANQANAASTRPAAAASTQPARRLAADGMDLPEVTSVAAMVSRSIRPANLKDVADLLLRPPDGLKIYSTARSERLLAARLGKIKPDYWCRWFAIGLGGADIAELELQDGVIARIVLVYRSPRAARMAAQASYGTVKIDGTSDHYPGAGPWACEYVRANILQTATGGGTGIFAYDPDDDRPATFSVDAQREMMRATEAAAHAEKDPIKQAIAERRITVGMTLAQAQQAVGPGTVVEENADGTRMYRWDFYHIPIDPGPTQLLYSFYGTLDRSGKLLSVRRVD